MTNVNTTMNRFDVSGFKNEIAAAITRPANPIAFDKRQMCVSGGRAGSE